MKRCQRWRGVAEAPLFGLPPPPILCALRSPLANLHGMAEDLKKNCAWVFVHSKNDRELRFGLAIWVSPRKVSIRQLSRSPRHLLSLGMEI